MQNCCLFFRRTPASGQLYALAICAHLPLCGSGLEVRRFSSEDEFLSALMQAGVPNGEQTRITRALRQSGRTLTYLTKAQAEGLRAVPLSELVDDPPLPTPKPSRFKVSRITARGVPYQMPGPRQQLTSSGGVLPAGQEVWLDGIYDVKGPVPAAQAFIENVGLVVLDTRWLHRKTPVAPITLSKS